MFSSKKFFADSPNAVSSKKNEAEVRCHDTWRNFGLSFLLGSATTCLLESQEGLPFSLAAGALASTAAFGVSYLQSRNSSLSSIPQLEDKEKDSSYSLSNKTEVKLPPIQDKYMSNQNPFDLDDGELYHVGFCFKRGFADWIEGKIIKQSPLKHSSFILVPVDMMYALNHIDDKEKREEYMAKEKRILILGRQSTAFRATNKHGFWKSSYVEKLNTEIDNEKQYVLFAGAAFESIMSEAVLTGEEVKAVVQRVNTMIGYGQLCDMINSNCYSASICVLAVTIEQLYDRYRNNFSKVDIDKLEIHPGASNKAYQQIRSLCELMLNVLPHNFGQGVLNNQVVMNQVNKAIKIANEFDVQQSKNLIEQNMAEINKSRPKFI